jgi:hypothetical protein
MGQWPEGGGLEGGRTRRSGGGEGGVAGRRHRGGPCRGVRLRGAAAVGPGDAGDALPRSGARARRLDPRPAGAAEVRPALRGREDGHGGSLVAAGGLVGACRARLLREGRRNPLGLGVFEGASAAWALLRFTGLAEVVILFLGDGGDCCWRGCSSTGPSRGAPWCTRRSGLSTRASGSSSSATGRGSRSGSSGGGGAGLDPVAVLHLLCCVATPAAAWLAWRHRGEILGAWDRLGRAEE